MALLSAYVEKGMTEIARDLFDEMEAKNVDSWNFMMSGYKCRISRRGKTSF